MMTPTELNRFIRFALSQLRDENAYHDFEHMSSAIARARISRNVIPATGPVGAAGDQGRDAESVPRLDGEPQEPGMFGDLSGRTVVLACTLQTGRGDTETVQRLRRKILEDIAEIKGYEHLKADVVVAFCEADLPIGVRNGIKEKAETKHGVELHILDGNAISALLAAPDLNWVAHKYLDLPREAVPAARTDEAEAWYLAQRLKWSERIPSLTWGDLEDLSQSVRYAYQHGFTADIDLWLDLLDDLNIDTAPLDLRRAVIYEITLANLRGRETLEPAADDLRWYFETVTDVIPSASLQDAQVLLAFCLGAAHAGVPGITPEETASWRETLVEHVDAEIAATDNQARLYVLLLVRGSLELFRGDVPDFLELLRWWEPALEHAEIATMLPIDLAADRLPPITPLYVDHPAFDRFAARVDELAAAQGGEAVSASNAIDRAASLLDGERWVAALLELHRAKGRLQEARESGRLLSALLIIGEAYVRLGLFMAAKQYFLATASIAINSAEPSHRRYVALGLAEAAGCDHATGAWLGFVELAGMATKAHGLLDVDPGDFASHPFLNELAYNSLVVAVAAQQHYPVAAPDAVALAKAHVPPDEFEEMSSDPPDGIVDEEGFLDAVAEQLHARPFDDAGSVRTIAWSAHGVGWEIRSSRDVAERRVAERLAAAMQVLQADLAGHDLVNLPATLTVDVRVGEPSVQESGPCAFAVSLSAWNDQAADDHDELERVMAETTAAAVTLLGRTSTLSDDDLMTAVESRLEEDLTNKLTMFRTYDEMLALWTAPELQGLPEPPGAPPSAPPNHPQLAWPDGPGPGYSKDAAQEALENRYRNLMMMTSATRAQLRDDTAFGEVIRELRDRGWLDWQILAAMQSVAASYRITRDVQAGRTTFEQASKVRFEDEPADDPVPTTEFTVEALERSRGVGDVTTLTTTWERTMRFRYPPLDAVDELLANRYGHREDDIDHTDPF